MACQPMHYWTFTGIVGAFLDLIIAYFLLCASTFAFFASKFLGFFGLSLPCPCNGLFGIPNTNYCFQSLLVDCSIDKLSSVQLSVKSKFPFDSVLGRDQNYNVLKLDRDGNRNVVELEAEGSSSSVSDARKDLQNVVRGESVTPGNENGAIGIGNGKERKFDMKGKGVMNQRLSGGFRRRRKGGFDGGKLSPVVVNQQKAPQSHREQNDKVDNSSELVGVSSSRYEMEALRVMKFGERALHEFGVDQPLVKVETEDRISSFVPESRNETQRQLVFDDEEKNTVKVLEQALEEEHAARAALYLELEKERNAAASAADEAMAMILRLQEEKASIEMEARQYQRIIEEKSAYDAEEMNILKEILLRREREKHFLEKEVEAYRQMLYLGNEQSESEGEIQDTLDLQREILAPQFDLTEDPDMMLHQLNESISKKKTLRNKSAGSEVMSTVQQNISLAIAKGLPIQGWHEDSDPFISITEGNQELKEKEVVSVDANLHSEAKEGKIFDSHLKSNKLSRSQENNSPENSIPVVGEEQGISGECMLHQGVGKKTVETGTYIGENSQNLEKPVNDALEGVKSSLTSDKEPYFLDVHVIDDESKLGDEFGGNKSKQIAADDPSQILKTSDLPHEAFLIQRNDAERGYPSTNKSDYEADINKSSSDINIEPPVVGSSGRPLVPDLRRNSMNALDTERSKIDTEVEWLRERLRVVQQGREKLKVSMEHREKETLQLQLLENIACQLREIQQLTEPGKALRQGSLPPPSSKVLSKKRRCRSVSVGLYKSS